LSDRVKGAASLHREATHGAFDAAGQRVIIKSHRAATEAIWQQNGNS
jgi:hypothetical protein